MSLLEKASIITTPTAYGVGVLNSIKPAYALGENLVVNGTFDTDSDWTKGTGWTISGGKANSDGSQTGTSNLFQNMGILSNKSVKVEYTISNFSAGHLDLSFFGTGLPASETRANANGNYIWYVNIPTGHNGNVGFSANSSFVGSVDNFSVKVETEADFDFTRNSSATRVNPDYLIQDVSILSSNLVQNGNFSELGSQLITNGNFETDSGWTKTNASISSGQATITVTGGAYSRVNQAVSYTSGKKYRLIANIKGASGSSGKEVRFMDNSSNIGGLTTSNGTITLNESVQTIELNWTANSNSGVIENARSTSSGDYSWDIYDISVKQVDPNDNWTLGTGWSFGEDKVSAVSTSVTTYQISNIVSGKKYLLKWEITDYTAGLFAMAAGGNIIDYWKSANGIYTQTVIAGSSGTIDLRCAGFTGSVSNISVIEVQQTDIPRLDYTNGTASILLEPQRTNLFEYDIDFSQSVWSKGNVTLQSNTAISPEGIQNASNIYPTNNVAYIYNTTTASSSVYTVSAYVKANGKNVAWLYSNSGSTNGTIYFDLSDESMQVVAGSGGTPTGTINKMPNGWYRITYTTGTAISLTGGTGVGVSDAKGSLNATQNGTDGILVYGLQLETGSYATSLIHTSGSASTRAAETLNNAGNSDLINSTEGVLYAEISALANDGANRCISLYDGTVNNRLTLLFGSTNNSIRALIKSNNATTFDATHIVNSTLNFHKIGVKYKENDFALWIDGVEVATDSSGATPIGLNALTFDTGNGGQNLYGRCKTVAVFKEALSDTELACLTSTNNREIFLNYYYRMQYVGANTEALSCAEQTFNI